MQSDGTERAHDHDTLGQKALLVGLFGATALAGFTSLRSVGRSMPPTRFRDLALLGLATNRLSRLLARDAITRPVRAPFTRLSTDSAQSEHVIEEPAGSGMRRVLGELLTCPRCTAMWSALGLTLGYTAAPRATRTVAMLLSVAALSDMGNKWFARSSA
jgi:hypothetical protein